MSEFEFVDDIPSNSRRTNPIIEKFAVALKERPGQWAKYPVDKLGMNYRGSISSRITNHKENAPRPLRQGYQARIYRGVIYVRYIGED